MSSSERLFTAEVGAWAGWQELPSEPPCWGVSPILITGVQPMKTGRSILGLRFVQAVHPVAAKRRVVNLRVTLRTATHLVGLSRDESGAEKTAVVSVVDYDWIRTHCQELWRRRPPNHPTMLIDGKPLPKLTPSEYLTDVFGCDERAVLAGATVDSFGCDHPPMPERCSRFRLDATFDPFDSWLILRGLVPKVMEEKWFIYRQDDALIFRRSWSGFMIYRIEAEVRGECLFLGEVTVNREPTHYRETDDDYDRRLVVFLIERILLGGQAPFPHRESMTPHDAALHAWGVAGKSVL